MRPEFVLSASPSMPNATVAANLAGQPEDVREQAKRLINAA